MAELHSIDWSFRFSNTTTFTEMLGTSRPDDVFPFATGLDLVRFMADDTQDFHCRFQPAIDKRINADPVARVWRRDRTLLRDLQHFPKYRRNDFDRYHAAARARTEGRVTAAQLALVDGLQAEIAASKVIVPAGQVLFHGRADADLTKPGAYPSFLSTSLNPVVARQSAFRRGGPEQRFGRPRVSVLTMDIATPALWGQAGKSCEYELLLPPGLTFTETASSAHRNFDVVTATVSRASIGAAAPRGA